jgi:two-component system, OmpR family, response regulator
MEQLTCLIVEDEPGIGWAVTRLLESAGAAVLLAASAAGALEFIGQQAVSMIFLDVKLPDADGFELAGVIHRIQPGIPIVIISAYFYPDDPKVQQMLGQGVAQCFIAKPFRHAEVLSALRELAPKATGNADHSPSSTKGRSLPDNSIKAGQNALIRQG